MNVNKHIQQEPRHRVYTKVHINIFRKPTAAGTNMCVCFFFNSLMNSVVHVVFYTNLSIPHYLASSFGKNWTLFGYRLSDLPPVSALFWCINLLTGLLCLVTAAKEDLDRGCSGERLRQGSVGKRSFCLSRDCPFECLRSHIKHLALISSGMDEAAH